MAESTESHGIHNMPKSSDVLASGNSVFRNSLIMERICSNVNSQADLLNLRLVNRVVQVEATKRLTVLHHHAQQYMKLKSKDRMNNFLSCMKTRDRESLQLVPFPFPAVEVNLVLNVETLETFGAAVGAHIKRYICFHPIGELNCWEVIEIGGKVAILLSHSPQLAELQLKSSHQLFLTKQDQKRLPNSFDSLNVIAIQGDLKRHDMNLLFGSGSSYSLIESVISRATRLKEVKSSINEKQQLPIEPEPNRGIRASPSLGEHHIVEVIQSLNRQLYGRWY